MEGIFDLVPVVVCYGNGGDFDGLFGITVLSSLRLTRREGMMGGTALGIDVISRGLFRCASKIQTRLFPKIKNNEK